MNFLALASVHLAGKAADFIRSNRDEILSLLKDCGNFTDDYQQGANDAIDVILKMIEIASATSSQLVGGNGFTDKSKEVQAQ